MFQVRNEKNENINYSKFENEVSRMKYEGHNIVLTVGAW